MLTEINKLSKNELKLFKQFVQSQYFNSYKTITELLKYLLSVYPNISKEDVSKEKISINIYKQNDVNEIKIRKLISDFNKIFDKFLVISVLENDKSLNEMLLLRAYREKLYTRKFNLQNNKTMKLYESSFVTNENTYSNISQVSEENFYYMYERNDNKLIYAYQKRAVSLDYFIIYKKLRSFIEEIISEVYMTKKLKIEKTFYNEVLHFAESNLKEIKTLHPYIYLNYLAVRFYENYELKYVEMFKEYQKEKVRKFDINLQIQAFELLKQIYMKIISKRTLGGKENKIMEELFEICDKIYMHPASVYIKYFKNKLKSFEFMVIVNMGCMLKKFDWTNEFIKKYGSVLSDEFKDDCYNVSLSNYCFAIKDFEKSIIYSNKVSNKVAHFFYSSKIKVLMCYCELNIESGITFSFENIKQYLKRNSSINDYDVFILKTFISFFTEFFKVRETFSDKVLRRNLAGLLIKKIEDYKEILYCRSWMIGKLKEM